MRRGELSTFCAPHRSDFSTRRAGRERKVRGTMVRAASFYEFRCDGTSGQRPHLQTAHPTSSHVFTPFSLLPDLQSILDRPSHRPATLITDHVTRRPVFIAIDPSFLLYFPLIPPAPAPDTFSPHLATSRRSSLVITRPSCSRPSPILLSLQIHFITL